MGLQRGDSCDGFQGCCRSKVSGIYPVRTLCGHTPDVIPVLVTGTHRAASSNAVSIAVLAAIPLRLHDGARQPSEQVRGHVNAGMTVLGVGWEIRVHDPDRSTLSSPMTARQAIGSCPLNSRAGPVTRNSTAPSPARGLPSGRARLPSGESEGATKREPAMQQRSVRAVDAEADDFAHGETLGAFRENGKRVARNRAIGSRAL